LDSRRAFIVEALEVVDADEPVIGSAVTVEGADIGRGRGVAVVTGSSCNEAKTL
jgi:Na+-translocating ferredoxin:NAD+ oxidoreductase RnfC subunit